MTPKLPSLVDQDTGRREGDLAGLRAHITRTVVAPAPRGRGSHAVGPITEARPSLGAAVLAPPGVWLRSPPEDEEYAYTRKGWRYAEWHAGTDGLAYLDRAEPSLMRPVELRWAVCWLGARDRTLVAWAQECVRRQIRDLTALLRPLKGDDPPNARTGPARAALRAVAVDAGAEFGTEWVNDALGHWAPLVRNDPRAHAELPAVVAPNWARTHSGR